MLIKGDVPAWRWSRIEVVLLVVIIQLVCKRKLWIISNAMLRNNQLDKSSDSLRWLSRWVAKQWQDSKNLDVWTLGVCEAQNARTWRSDLWVLSPFTLWAFHPLCECHFLLLCELHSLTSWRSYPSRSVSLLSFGLPSFFMVLLVYFHVVSIHAVFHPSNVVWWGPQVASPSSSLFELVFGCGDPLAWFIGHSLPCLHHQDCLFGGFVDSGFLSLGRVTSSTDCCVRTLAVSRPLSHFHFRRVPFSHVFFISVLSQH